ncbi:TonB-dependent siderophore receptor [Novosphingobium sp. 9]|uniref:TonB-dependent siderophore receptor n=1 Tax=Novosphingobium sp. 9 TaxID=2025349 RepID=UPI0021B5E78D|nr:TonB-dependent siderophore receptor [Novosphingobium sp. 9]
MVTGRAAPVAKGADDRYQPTPDASTLRSTAPMLEVPQAVNIVSAQILRDQRPRYLDDSLANVSGITQGNTLAGTQDTIMKRGFGGNRDGSIMHNGMPLVQGRGFNAAAQSVEVLKGPSSLLYGIMDPGGVINIVSKKPELSAHTSVSVAGSTYAHARNGYDLTLDTTAPIGSTGLAYRLVVDHVDEDYWRNFGKHRETLIAPSLAYYGDNTKIVVWYEYRDYLTPFDRGTALDPDTKKPLDIPKTRRLDEPFNNMWGKTHLAQTSIDQQLGNGWAAHVSLSFNSETYDANQLRVTGVNTTTGTLTRSDDATHGALSTDYYGTAYIDGHVDLLGMRHDLQIGVEAESRKIYRKDLLRQKTTSTFSYLDPVYGQEEASSTVSASDSDQTDKLHNYSVFAQDSIHVTDKLIAIAGGRGLNWNQIAGRGRPFNTNTDTGDTVILPRAGLVYKWSPVFSLYASYSQSLKPASTIAPLTAGVVLDSGFAPERARSWEAGAKLDIPGGISGTLAVYDIHKRNVLVSQYNDATQLTDYRTAGAARARGVELDLAGQVTSRLSAIGSFAYLDGKITQDPDYAGNKLWNAAKFTGSLSAVYDAGAILGQDKLRFGGGPHYVGRRAGDSANSFFLPSYITADAFATYETRLARRNVTFQFNVKNIFDKLYYPSSVNTYFVSVGDTRQFSLRATVDL